MPFGQPWNNPFNPGAQKQEPRKLPTFAPETPQTTRDAFNRIFGPAARPEEQTPSAAQAKPLVAPTEGARVNAEQSGKPLEVQTPWRNLRAPGVFMPSITQGIPASMPTMGNANSWQAYQQSLTSYRDSLNAFRERFGSMPLQNPNMPAPMIQPPPAPVPFQPPAIQQPSPQPQPRAPLPNFAQAVPRISDQSIFRGETNFGANRLTPSLVMSSRPKPGSGPALKAQGIDVVIDMVEDGAGPLNLGGGILYHHFGIWDSYDGIPPDQQQKAEQAASLAAQYMAAGYRVLINCWAGRNRSGLVSALALQKLGYTPQQSLDLVRGNARGLSNPRFQQRVLTGRW